MKRFVSVCIFTSLISCFLTGCFHQHDWRDASCFSPKTCIDCGVTEGEPLEHAWNEADCENPMICIRCGKTEGDKLGHNYNPATCVSPMKCNNCGDTVGEKSEHDWTNGSKDSPRICNYCNVMEPLPFPKSGQVFIGSDLYRGSELSIVSSTTKSCYIKLKGTTGNDVFSFFVRAGESITVDVPRGNFYVYFSYGNDWYGPEYLFGDHTTYAKDDEICDFENYTWSYELTPIYDGNFSETPVSEEEFK